MSRVLIVSQNADFSEVVAEQVERELKAETVVAGSVESARALLPTVQAVVAGEALPGKWPVPVIPVIPGKDTPVRLQAVLLQLSRALSVPEGDTAKLGRGYVLSLRQKTVTHVSSGGEATLTDKEAHLLFALAAAGGTPVAKEALLKKIWGQDAGLESHTLETHIYRLRAKLKALGMKDAVAATPGGYALAVKK